MAKHKSQTLTLIEIIDRIDSHTDENWFDVMGIDLPGLQDAKVIDGPDDFTAQDRVEAEYITEHEDDLYEVRWPEHVTYPKFNSDASYLLIETCVELAVKDEHGCWELLGAYQSVEQAKEAAKEYAALSQYRGEMVFGISTDPESGHYEIDFRVEVAGDRLSDKATALVTKLLVECGEEPSQENIEGFAGNHAYIEAAANGDVESLAMLRRNCGLEVF